MRDAGALESALAGPRNRWSYGEVRDIAELAASYASSLVRSHPLVDGNKRTAFLVAYVFLARNGRDLEADEAEVASTMWKLSAGEIGETELGDWIRTHARSTR